MMWLYFIVVNSEVRLALGLTLNVPVSFLFPTEHCPPPLFLSLSLRTPSSLSLSPLALFPNVCVRVCVCVCACACV